MEEMGKGLYFAWEVDDVFGLAVAVVYQVEYKDFQIAVKIGVLHIAIGCAF